MDLKSAYLELQDEINVSIGRILSGGIYVLGDEVEFLNLNGLIMLKLNSVHPWAVA